ncbi:MAG: phosphodiesterase [Peptococcaceae bacterium]|nr:phosphodiesterase [Peptococcaceae bacterium]
MKIMIASDLHGSVSACRQLLACFERERPEKLLLLGDLLYHGPRNDLTQEYDPKKVAEMLNDIQDKIICVRGNCDTEVDQAMLEFPIMAEYTILNLEDRIIFATHGHRFQQGNALILEPGDIVVQGHTHLAGKENRGHYHCLNPGSAALPRGGSKAGYILLEDNIFSWKTLSGEVYAVWEIE